MHKKNSTNKNQSIPSQQIVAQKRKTTKLQPELIEPRKRRTHSKYQQSMVCLVNRNVQECIITTLNYDVLFIIAKFLANAPKGFEALRTSCKYFYTLFSSTENSHNTQLKLFFLIHKLSKEKGWNAYLGKKSNTKALKKAKNLGLLLESYKFITSQNTHSSLITPMNKSFQKWLSSKLILNYIDNKTTKTMDAFLNNIIKEDLLSSIFLKHHLEIYFNQCLKKNEIIVKIAIYCLSGLIERKIHLNQARAYLESLTKILVIKDKTKIHLNTKLSALILIKHLIENQLLTINTKLTNRQLINFLFLAVEKSNKEIVLVSSFLLSFLFNNNIIKRFTGKQLNSVITSCFDNQKISGIAENTAFIISKAIKCYPQFAVKQLNELMLNFSGNGSLFLRLSASHYFYEIILMEKLEKSYIQTKIQPILEKALMKKDELEVKEHLAILGNLAKGKKLFPLNSTSIEQIYKFILSGNSKVIKASLYLTYHLIEINYLKVNDIPKKVITKIRRLLKNEDHLAYINAKSILNKIN